MVQQQINANDFNWHKQRLKTKGFNMNDLFSLNLNGDATTVRLCCIRCFFLLSSFHLGQPNNCRKKEPPENYVIGCVGRCTFNVPMPSM